MEGSGLSASDVLALTRDNDGMFGGVGGFILLFIFLMAISGNGFGFGGNGSTGLALADIQNSLYNQSQDNNARSLAQGQCNIVDTILNANYNNLLASKDISNQISNQTLAITNTMAQNTNAILAQMNANVINDLRDKLDITRAELSNANQTAQITENILSNLATTAPKPPCYYGAGCGCNSLY
jgi:microcystin-dependent protein